MAKKKPFFSQFRLVYRPSPLLLKCVVLASIIFSIAALAVIKVDTMQHQQKKDSDRVQAAQLEQEIAHIEQTLQQKDTVDGIKQIAEDELGLVDQDTVFFDVVTNQD